MDIEIWDALRLDERVELTLAELVDASGMTEAELRELVDCGALAPLDREAASWTFCAQALIVVRTAGRLRRELDLDAHAAAVILRYVERIEALEAELRALRAGVAR
jgi:chaperone modulatory protein CbpM